MTARGWHVTRLHHVAYAHQDPAVSGLLGDLLGLTCGHEEAGVGFTERMLPAGAAFLQLLESSGPGVIEQFLQRRGPGLHHVAFEVTSIEAAVADLRERGVRMVDEVPRPGGMGTMIAFIHPHACAGLLVELVGETAAETAAERRAEESRA